ncbi:type II secretion system protein GspM [Cupriavidus sp. WS]|uniref:type II secretion system protein GspM n=1 Tax=Cupriavidus sp. WS TaxID=1312922 RepID=UPI00037C10AB|nr:type II secretion system protein GspM [Cupriavidus sp. WS]
MNAPLDDTLLVPEAPATASRQRRPLPPAVARGLLAWRALTPRDRRAVMVCAAAISTACGWLAGWEPAASAIPRLQRELPLDHAQLAQLQLLAKQAQALRALPDIPPRTGAALRDAVAGSLETAGIAGATVEAADHGVRVRADKVSFYAWMQWLAGARQAFGLDVLDMEARAAAGGERGAVTVSAALTLPAP